MITAPKVTDWVFLYRRISLVLFAALILFLAAGVPRLQFSSDSRGFFGLNNQEYRDVLKIDDTYTISNSLLLMVVPPVGTAFAPETLKICKRFLARTFPILT